MRFLRRLPVRAAIASMVAALALPAIPALAQGNAGVASDSIPDLVPVTIWTVVTIFLVLSVASVGYLYRKQRGLDHPLHIPPPEEIDEPEDHDNAHAASGHH